MATEIVIAVIAAGGSILGSVIVNLGAVSKQRQKTLTKLAIVETEVRDLKEEVRKHNNVIERLYKVENEV